MDKSHDYQPFEELLRDSVEAFKSLFEHTTTGIFVSSKAGKFISANQALLNMLVKRLVNVVLGFGNMIFSYLGLYLTQYVV